MTFGDMVLFGYTELFGDMLLFVVGMLVVDKMVVLETAVSLEVWEVNKFYGLSFGCYICIVLSILDSPILNRDEGLMVCLLALLLLGV